MKILSTKEIAWWNVIALLLGVVPVALFWFLFDRAPGISVTEARALLTNSTSGFVLVDLRSPDAFASNHISGAINLPLEQVDSLRSPQALPPALQGKKLILVCQCGLSSAMSATKLQSAGFIGVRHIAGGMQAWLAHRENGKSQLPFRPMARWEQFLPPFIAFILKPIYMTIAFVIIVWLWRQKSVELAMLRWGLIWFWLGENGCSIDFLFFNRISDFWEYAHGYGMVVGFSMISYAILEGVDARLIKFSPESERCAALNLCRHCIKYENVPCGLKRLFKIAIPALAVLCFIPMAASLTVISYDTEIFGRLYAYYHMVSSQLFEWRFCPAVAFIFFLIAWLVLLFKRSNPVQFSKMFLSAGLGFLGFGLLRLFFVSSFYDNLMWFDVWEETTEFLFLFGTTAVLWIFRDSLFVKKPKISAASPAPVSV